MALTNMDQATNLSNVTLSNPNISQEAQLYSIHYFDLAIGILLPGILSLLGIAGNGISLYVMHYDKRHSVNLFSLQALAFSDVVLLSAAFIQQPFPMLCAYIDEASLIARYSGYLRVYAWPIICIAQMTSIWVTILISAERFMTICTPGRTLRNMTYVKGAVFTIVTISILFNVPKFFEYCTETYTDETSSLTYVTVGITSLRQNEIYRYLYNTVMYCIIMYIIPLILLVYLNTMIVYRLRCALRIWGNLTKRQKREYKATVVPLCIVLVFFVCGTQALMSFIFDAIYMNSNQSWLQYYTAVVNLLVIINSAINIIIFYSFGKRFRLLLKLCFAGCTGPNIQKRGELVSPIFRRKFNVAFQSV